MLELAVSIDLIPDSVITVDRAGVIQQVNRQLTAMFGYRADELVGQPIEILLPKRVRQRHVNYRRAFQTKPTMRPMGGDLELFGRRKDDSEFPVDIMLNPLSSDDGRVLAVIRDTSAAKAMSDRLAQLAYSDSLTKLPNRAALYRELEQSLRNDAQSSSIPMAIALFDLDCFKEINDTMGHSCGDQLLKDVAGRWSDVVGQGTRIYRLGGDEFVLTIDDCGDPRVAVTIVNALLRELDRSFEIAGTIIFASACAGIALAPAHGADAEELIANVDMALYKAKANGRGSHAFYDKTLRARVLARKQVDDNLRQAYLRGELELYFQPQVRLADGAVVGAEALLRWNRGRTVVQPKAFIDILACSAIAASVGSWILRTTCETVASWRNKDLRPGRVAVNLFPVQLQDPSFIADLEQILAETGLTPDSLELEITENIALSRNAATLAMLRKLQQLGIGIAFDDFGTGYASLSLLTEMPLTHIKVDRSFIRGLPTDRKLVAIARSLITMAHNVDLAVIAEGVETVEQARFLQAEGCDEAQGFLFARPLPTSMFEALLESRTGLAQSVRGAG